MQLNWWNDYVGIPYVVGGRTREGLDCWGLVRLVYDEQLGIKLPSFEHVAPGDEAAEVMARNREEWLPVADVSKPGDVALFRVLGSESHVGLVTQGGHFLHAREGYASTIERFDAGVWQNRLVGRFRYAGPKSLVSLTGMPHPLKTERIDAVAPEGASLGHMIRVNCKLAGLPDDLVTRGFAFVDEKLIPYEEWDLVFPKAGQSVAFRIVPQGGGGKGGGGGGGILRTILLLAVVVAAIFIPPLAVSALGLTGAAATITSGLLGLAISGGGSLLVNAIAPIRQPKQDVSKPRDRFNLSGGSNYETPYGAIPVVLGQHRFTPPVGAKTFIEQSGITSYLRMLLVWGYGPLEVSDLRVGDTPINTFEELEYETLPGVEGQAMADFNQLYGRDVDQENISAKLLSSEDYLDRTTTSDVDEIHVQFSFPEGLFGQSQTTGKLLSRTVRVSVQVKQNGTDDWYEVNQRFGGKSFYLSSARALIDTSLAYNEEPDAADWWLTTYGGAKYRVGKETAIPLYRWYLVTLDRYNNIILREGSLTNNQYGNPSGRLLDLLAEDNYGLVTNPTRLPSAGVDEEELYRICVYDQSIVAVEDRRGVNGSVTVSGCNISYSGRRVSISSGTISRAQTYTLETTRTTKDPFEMKVKFFVPRGTYRVRVRRTNANDNYTNPTYDDVYWTTLTTFTNRRPVNQPKPLAMTAIRVKATNQLNGTLEGVTGTVKSICLDYDRNSDAWVSRPTRNPASLFRYVLQHPAFAQPVADSAIDLDTLERWHTFCRYQGFYFDTVIVNQRPIFDVLADIAAAGRASPTVRDGKWSVVIDEPRRTVVQHFTPHNSFDFSSTKLLPKMPHGFRVRFNNKQKGYQPDERIVYADGYSASNATLIEGLELPGVTDPDAVHSHARFHLAQLALRPEEYALNTDLEHLVCTRGDLVRVTHDVPMWGLGTGRIAEVTNTTTLVLDEAVPMDAGVQYTIRIRRETGATLTRTVEAKETDGFYTTITLTSAITSGNVKAGDLFMFGALSSESVECLVKTIEPTGTNTARLTLVDYAPAVFNADDEEIPAFDSQITLPPVLQRTKVVELPTVSSVVSDERALIRNAAGQYVTSIKVGFRNPKTLTDDVNYVEAQVASTDDSPREWKYAGRALVSANTIYIQPVEEGETYDVRIRYLRDDLNAGPWRTVATAHTVVGKSTPPTNVQNFGSAFDGNTGAVLTWNANEDVDLAGYEIRVGSSWSSASVLVTKLQANRYKIPTITAASTTYLIKAIDTAGNYSATEASRTVSIALPHTVAPAFAISGENVVLSWNVTSGTIATDYYLIRYGSTFEGGTDVATIKATRYRTRVDWSGTRRFWIAAVDLAGNVGTADYVDVTITPPSAVTITQEVIDNNVLLRWSDATQTLPVATYEIRKGSTFSTATVVGRTLSRFSAFFESVSGNYRYWVVGIDSAGNYGTQASVVARVAEPPDYELKLNQDSTFAGTISNLKKEDGKLFGPFDTTETWASHFTSRSWTTIQNQIDAGYEYFLQPSAASGYYEETIDYGTVLSGTRIIASINSTTIDGSVTITPKISVRASTSDPWTDYAGLSEVYATGFRYVKVRYDITASGGDDLVEIDSLNIRLDAKLRNDAGRGYANASDSGGTAVSFNKAFVDISSITVTPKTTSAAIAVYDFVDVPNPTGFKVYLFNTSGTRISGDFSWSAKGA